MLKIDSRTKKKGFKIGILYIAALCDDPGSFHTRRCSWGTSGPKSHLVDHRQGVPFWGHQLLHSMDLKLQNGKTGTNAAQSSWKREIRKAGKGEEGSSQHGEVPGKAEDAAPAMFWGRATSASHKLPNSALFFGWVTRLGQARVAFLVGFPTWARCRQLQGRAGTGENQQTLGCQTCHNCPNYSSSHSYHMFRYLFLFKEELEVLT